MFIILLLVVLKVEGSLAATYMLLFYAVTSEQIKGLNNLYVTVFLYDLFIDVVINSFIGIVTLKRITW